MRGSPRRKQSYILPRGVPKVPYDPVDEAHVVEEQTCKGAARLYTCVSLSPNFSGSVKAYAVGCNLRCGFCWSPSRTVEELHAFRSRRDTVAQAVSQAISSLRGGSSDTIDEPIDADAALREICPVFLTPNEVIERMLLVARNRMMEGIGTFELCTEGPKPRTVSYFTISGGEPTLSRAHLLAVLKRFCECAPGGRFLLQSNGFLFGADPSYLEALACLRDHLEIRISLKAGSPEALFRRTGAFPNTHELPFHAIHQLLRLGFDFHLAAMSDPTVMPRDERDALLGRVAEVCGVYSKSVYLMPNLSESPNGDAERRANIRDAVFLDEECYVPMFPSIIGRGIEA